MWHERVIGIRPKALIFHQAAIGSMPITRSSPRPRQSEARTAVELPAGDGLIAAHVGAWIPDGPRP
jgi:hypothetical protein